MASEDPEIMKEFQEWFERHSDTVCRLENKCWTLDLNSLSGEQFIVVAPENYISPNERKAILASPCSATTNGSESTTTAACSSNNSSVFQLKTTSKTLKSWLISECEPSMSLDELLENACQLYGKKFKDDVSGSLSTSSSGSGSGTVDRLNNNNNKSMVSCQDDVDLDCEYDDDEYDDDDDMDTGEALMMTDEDDDIEFTTEFEIQMDIRKKKWQNKETELRAKWAKEKEKSDQRAENNCSSRHSESSKRDLEPRMGQQIFTHNSAAFQILSNELIALIKDGKNDGLQCDSVDDSLYQWKIFMSNFDRDSEFGADMIRLESLHGYAHVEIELEFSPDFPFYPPILRVVRPKFCGSLIQSITNIDHLRLTYWNPTDSIRNVLLKIKSIIQEHAKINVESPMNDPKIALSGSYLSLEDNLIRLAMAAEVRPRANYSLVSVDSLTKAPAFNRKHSVDELEEAADQNGVDQSSKGADGATKEDSNSRRKGCWAKGVGYGSTSDHGRGWNPATQIIAQKEKERRIQKILEQLAADMDDLSRQIDSKDDNDVEELTQDDEDDNLGDSNNDDDNNVGSKGGNNGKQKKRSSMKPPSSSSIRSEELYDAFEGSALIPFLQSEFYKPSHIEVFNRQLTKYESILDILERFIMRPENHFLLPLFGNLPRQAYSSFAQLALDMSNSMKQWVKSVLAIEGEKEVGPLMEKEKKEKKKSSSAASTAVSYASSAATSVATKPLSSSSAAAGASSSGEEKKKQAPGSPSGGSFSKPPQSTIESSSYQLMSPGSSLVTALSSISKKKYMLKKSAGAMCQKHESAAATQENAGREKEKCDRELRFAKRLISLIDEMIRLMKERRISFDNSNSQDIKSAVKPGGNAAAAAGFSSKTGLESWVIPIDCNSSSHHSSMDTTTSSPPTMAASAAVSCHQPSTSSSSFNNRQLEERYIAEMKPFQFLQGSINADPAGNDGWLHHFAKKKAYSASAAQIGRTEKRRILTEWSSIRDSLPLNFASSVFVLVDDAKLNLMRAMVVGPQGTPYADGLFLFDIAFPPSYPAIPPQFNLQTTGGNTVRFNPNLYECGKVCLSILGTWSGVEGETWNAATSTLLQVLVSIQSLILVDEPFFNEPGYESLIGTKDGRKKSDAYNKNIRENAVKWAILEQLKSPPPGFEDVVRNHFRIKKESVINQLEQWDKEGKASVRDKVPLIKAELDKLL